ncbi:hypothetical protein [Nocardia sp. CDC160]|uniref:hypothetical protein n=1 Tax=Nocardia sp. CDC160 TaxID=3112166 RepID=UPI002DBD9D28|nr:hypothetical protein [Nocardia sp. CDC160]MEC3919397.1 hypothetical protein [Nocardia sp. CDC160]
MITDLLNDILSNPVARTAITRAQDARDAALSAQETVMALLNLPTAAEVETIAHRIKSISQRLESLEDAIEDLTRLSTTITKISRQLSDLDTRLSTTV